MGLKSGKTDIFYIYMELVSSFSGMDGFSGWMIAKAEFKIEKVLCGIDKTSIGERTDISRKFIKHRKNYSVISTSLIYKNLEYKVIMYIVKPCGIVNKSMGNEYKPANVEEAASPVFNYLFTLKYTLEDIKRFTEYTGDNNPIHQTTRPIVPGFLMFGDIIRNELYKYITGNSSVKFVIYFRAPVYAYEPLEAYMKDGTGKIIAVQPGGYADIREGQCYKWETEIITEV
ncbi:MAG: MaoC family dehydratase [Lachnospiraceae bacterium]|nr:MaoC family dehydratase [Lachnospiraceae bacterium]